MSKAQQVKLNIILSDKLADYLMTKPAILEKFSGCSYVVFSHSNMELNKLNNKLISELKLEGKLVVKAEETKKTKTPWILTPQYN